MRTQNLKIVNMDSDVIDTLFIRYSTPISYWRKNGSGVSVGLQCAYSRVRVELQ
jgi:hypothetical protein